MIQLSCPACGSEIVFKSRSTVFAVCSYCRSTILRQDLRLEVYGKMSEVIEDLSPLQIGSLGKYEGRAFEILGRVRLAWSEGYWTEWYALFEDGSEGWLAEAQGFYGLCFNNKWLKPPDHQQVFLGALIEVVPEQELYEVVDIKETVCVASEGELPFKSPVGRKSASVDLSDSNGRFATLEYSEEEPRFFVGSYLDFDDFNFRNLREIEGWSYGH